MKINYEGKFAFISRHQPTPAQMEICAAHGVELISIGDRDAFSVTTAQVLEAGAFDGVVVVHPAAAMRLAGDFLIGVFENSQRSEDGGKLTFFAKDLHIYDLRD